MTEKKENLKKKGGFVPSFRLGEMITGRGKTTFGRTVRNFVLLLSLVAVLILILLGGHLITKPKPALITLEALKIAREKISELPERGLSAADVYKQGETKAYPHEDVKRLIITPSEIKAMELEK
jgi:cytochrome c biogenesis protein CcdA